MQMKTLLILICAITLLAVTSCKPFSAPQNITTNVTQNLTGSGIEKTEFGDLLTINYVLKLENGTVVDTNNEELAKQANLSSYVKGPYVFILGQSGKIQSFDKALVGIELGEKVTRTIEPTEPELFLDMNLTQVIPRTVTLNRYEKFKLESFEKLFNKPPIKGDVVFNPEFPWQHKVLNVTNTSVIAQIHIKEGEKYRLPSTQWDSTALRVEEESVTFFQTPKENMTIETEFGSATVKAEMSKIYLYHKPKLGKVIERAIPIGGIQIKQKFKIVNITDEKFTIQRIGVLTDKRLILEAEVLDIVKDVKELKEDVFQEIASIN